VKSGGKEAALTDQNHVFFVAGQDLDARADRRHLGRTNKDRSERLRAECRHSQVGLKTVHLTAKRIAAGGHIQQPQPRLIGALDLPGQ